MYQPERSEVSERQDPQRRSQTSQSDITRHMNQYQAPSRSEQRLRSPGRTRYDMKDYSTRTAFIEGPGSYAHYDTFDPVKRPEDQTIINNAQINKLFTGEKAQLKGWINADGRPEYRPTQNRSDAIKKGNETRGIEGRRAGVKKGNETRGIEGRREAAEKGRQTLGKEGRSKATEKGASKRQETMGADGRSAATKKGSRKRLETMGEKGLREAGEKGKLTKLETMGKKGLSEAGEKGKLTKQWNKLEKINEDSDRKWEELERETQLQAPAYAAESSGYGNQEGQWNNYAGYGNQEGQQMIVAAEPQRQLYEQAPAYEQTPAYAGATTGYDQDAMYNINRSTGPGYSAQSGQWTDDSGYRGGNG